MVSTSIASKVDANEAGPGVLLAAYNAPAGNNPNVYILEASQAGHLALAPVALGSGDIGTPVMIGSGDFLPLSGGSLTGNLTVTDTVFAKAAAGNAAFCVLDSASAAKGYFYFEKSDGSTRMTNSAGGNALVLVPDGSMNFQQGGTNRLSINASGNATFTGQVVANATLYSLNGMVCARQPTASGGSVFQCQTPAGAALAQMYWEPADSTFRMWHNSGQWALVNSVGFQTAGAIKSNQGYFCKAGTAGGFTNIFNINWTGTCQIWIDATNLGTVTFTSDYRTKKDVEDLPSTWDLVKDLRPIRYTHKDFFATDAKEDAEPLIAADDIERWGFVAHELQEL